MNWRYVIKNSEGRPITMKTYYDAPEDIVITFTDQISAALFMINKRLDPRAYYWEAVNVKAL